MKARRVARFTVYRGELRWNLAYIQLCAGVSRWLYENALASREKHNLTQTENESTNTCTNTRTHIKDAREKCRQNTDVHTDEGIYAHLHIEARDPEMERTCERERERERKRKRNQGEEGCESIEGRFTPGAWKRRRWEGSERQNMCRWNPWSNQFYGPHRQLTIALRLPPPSRDSAMYALQAPQGYSFPRILYIHENSTL